LIGVSSSPSQLTIWFQLALVWSTNPILFDSKGSKIKTKPRVRTGAALAAWSNLAELQSLVTSPTPSEHD
jgi:hypothetical protein